MQSLVGIRRSVYASRKEVKTVVDGNNDWLKSKEREAQKEIFESHKKPSYRTSGRDPAVLRPMGKQAPNGFVSGFRGSQKDNGHPPNGGPGGSARRFRPPRPAPRATHLRSVPDPAGNGDQVLAAIYADPRAPADVSLRCPPAHPPLFAWPSSLTRPPSPPEARRQERTPPDTKKEAQAFLVKADFIGAPGPPRARRPLPLAAPGPPTGRDPAFGRPRPAPQAPSPAAPGAARTAHRLQGGGCSVDAPLPSAARARGGGLRSGGTAKGGGRATRGGGGGGGALTSRAAAASARGGRPRGPNPGGARVEWAGPRRRTGRSIGRGGGARGRAGK